jgi:DegV family protein with EDD domain
MPVVKARQVPDVAIVTDSTCDLDPEECKALGITVVPLFVIFGDQSYRDQVEISRRDFFLRMEKETALPTTSQPTAMAFENAFYKFVRAQRPIVGIFLASYLSGTINAAHAAASQFPAGDITLLDSQTISGGLGLQVRLAAEMAQRGASRAEIVAALEERRARSLSLATIPDLTHAVRTGRVNRTMAAIGNVFKIVPVLRIGATSLSEEAKVRTFARALDAMVSATVKASKDVARTRITVAHANDPRTGRALLEALRRALPGEPQQLDLVEAGPVISVHTGPGAAAIFSLPG